MENIKNEDIGYNAFFESNRNKLKLEEFSIARVIVEHKGVYKIKNKDGEYSAKVTGKQMFTASSREDYPAVGDWVAITILNKDQAIINKVLPRQTVIKRKSNNTDDVQVIATNIDVAFVVESIDRDYSLNRLERYFAIANDEGIKPTIILNKVDLIPKENLGLKLTEIRKRFSDTDIILTSTITEEGLDELREYVTKRKTYCFLGSSGVGKSSLINKLLEEDIIKTKDIGSRTGRGKHTTTNREMYFLKNGGIVIDNPGMREVGMTNTNIGIDNLFDEIIILSEKCKFSDCTHVHESGCEVLSALESNKLDKNKYNNYINLKKETEFYEMSKIEKKEKNYKFGKFLKKAKKEIKKYR